MLRTLALILLIIVLLLIVFSPESQAAVAKGTHRLELDLGTWVPVSSEATVSADGVSTAVGNAGMLGSFVYSNYFQRNMAVTVGASGLALDIESRVGASGVTTRTAIVSAIRVGMRYYFVESSLDGTSRPYLSISMGPYMGSESETSVGSTVVTSSKSLTAFGGRVGAGFDVDLSTKFVLGMVAGYNLMTDFSEPVGSRVNYSGPDFAISISLLLSGSR